MPAFLLLLVMSLTVASHQTTDKTRPIKVAARQIDAPKTKSIANDKAIKSEGIAIPIALSDAATAPPAIAILEAATKGLFMLSETDATFKVKFWPSEKIELLPGDVATLVEQSIDAPIETKTVAAFFKNAAAIEDWMGDDEKANAQKFQKLIVTLEAQLENPRVYLFGERARTVVILGKVKGGFGGVVTLVVET